MIDDTQQQIFQTTVRQYYQAQGRHDLPWRQPDTMGNFNPYHILLSEMMLQQTQVGRVIPKYQEFLEQFPNLNQLAAAPLGEVLRVWSGLGYNRRAKFLHHTAGRIIDQHGGKLPQQSSELIALPGIGTNTAGAILAYAFNQPAAFVETNIRTVFIHHFFDDAAATVAESAIVALVADTLDHDQPREWYWALMDYGSHLKQSVGNLNARSGGYTRQSRFQGSRRQLRGQLIRLLGGQAYELNELREIINDERLEAVLAELVIEQLVHRRRDQYHL